MVSLIIDLQKGYLLMYIKYYYIQNFHKSTESMELIGYKNYFIKY